MGSFARVHLTSSWSSGYLPQQNQNLFLLYRTGSKPAGDNVFNQTHLDIHSWMVASQVQLTGLKQVVTPQQIQNLFLLYRTGSKPAGDKFFLSEHTLTFTRGWLPQRFLLIDLSEVVNPTSGKSKLTI
jgi:hypothetical protein